MILRLSLLSSKQNWAEFYTYFETVRITVDTYLTEKKSHTQKWGKCVKMIFDAALSTGTVFFHRTHEVIKHKFCTSVYVWVFGNYCCFHMFFFG